MILHIFNPENDLALADGGANYCPPPAAAQIAKDLGALPLWFADAGDAVLLSCEAQRRYRDDVSAVFDVALCYDSLLKERITAVRPWGWSAQMKRRLRVEGFDNALLPDDEIVEKVRALSNRRTAIGLLQALKKRGIDVPELPFYFTCADDVAAFVESVPRCVVKAPWSGSGKGIMWGLGRVEVPLENFYKGVIRRQGGVVCEYFLSSEREFAMEFFASEGGVRFVGYSLFDSLKGGYSGNVLAADFEIEALLAGYLPLEELLRLKGVLTELLADLLRGSGYKGYLGVDMMIYSDESGRLRLNPCMEINLRMNMGVVSRIIYDRFVSAGKGGCFKVSYFKERGRALQEHLLCEERYPLEVENGRVVSGYLNLSPVTCDNHYLAYIIVD